MSAKRLWFVLTCLRKQKIFKELSHLLVRSVHINYGRSCGERQLPLEKFNLYIEVGKTGARSPYCSACPLITFQKRLCFRRHNVFKQRGEQFSCYEVLYRALDISSQICWHENSEDIKILYQYFELDRWKQTWIQEL